MLPQFLFLTFGTLLTLLFLLFLYLGRKYDSATAPLSKKEHPFKDLYGVGFFWQETPPLRLRGKLGRRLLSQAQLLYGRQYAEYYARLAWAKTITLLHLTLAVAFTITAFVQPPQAPLLLLSGGLVALGVGNYGLDNMKDRLEDRRRSCGDALPDIVTRLALLVNSGMVIREAWQTTANSGEGTIYDLMRLSVGYMENGSSISDAVYEFGVLSDTPEIKKMTGALIQGLEKGNADLSYLLIQQSSEQWNHKKQVMLQRGEVAASKLLLPIGLMFIGILIIIVVPIFTNVLASL